MHYRRDDVIAALRQAGLQRGDTVFFTTSLGMLGIAEGVTTAEDLNRLHLECIREVLGPEGTILVPTYSYTFGKSTLSRPAVFDPTRTPAEIGPFPEFFRQQPGVKRSLDPMMSVSGLGPACAALFADLPPSSYGEDCLFARLARVPAKCCSIGLGPNWTPFIHHADWLARVPFRYDKIFHGVMMVDGEARDAAWVYSVRIRAKESFANAHRLGRLAEREGIWRHAPLGRARVYAADYREYFEFTVAAQKRDPWITAAGPPGDPLALERERVGTRPVPVHLPPQAKPHAILTALAPLRRDVVSDGMDAAFAALASQWPLQLHSYPTGTNCLDWVVPEKWTCQEFSLTRADGDLVKGDSPLHPASYSLSFEGEVSRDELVQHLHVHQALTDAVPFYRYGLLRDWGLCCTRGMRDGMVPGTYRVVIRTDFSYDRMQVGEVTIPGDTDETVLLCAYLDHPGQANAALSGALVGLEAVQHFQAQGQRLPLSWRLLLLPGPEGLAAWLDTHRDLVSRIRGGIVLRMLGRSLPFRMQESGEIGSWIDRSCGALLASVAGSDAVLPPRRVADELPKGGNPVARETLASLGIPFVTLARTLPPDDPDFPFRGCGSHLDQPAGVEPEALDQSRRLLVRIMEALGSAAG